MSKVSIRRDWTKGFPGTGPAEETYLVDRLDDPIDSGVAADGLMLRVNQNDLKVFVGGVLVDPIRIEDPKVGAAAANSLLSSGFERALVFQLIDSLICGLACSVDHVSRSEDSCRMLDTATDHR